MKRQAGYTFIILLVMLTILAIGLLVALPVWKTELQRENEEELIFRGRQYVEAVRLFQRKNAVAFPKSVEDLVKGRFLRRAYADPMSRDGKWDYILQAGPGTSTSSSARGTTPANPPSGPPGGPPGAGGGASLRVFVVSAGALSSIDSPRLIGVVSRSTRKSILLYNGNETYDTWLFFYGQDPNAKPEIIRFDRTEK